jgi:hypothetical protein
MRRLLLPSALALLLLLLPAAEALAEGGPPPGPGRERLCRNLERALGLLEWTASAPPGGQEGAWMRAWREQAIRTTAFRFADLCVRIDHLQVLGTHNSYHLQPLPALLQILLLFDPAFIAWEYSHLPLDAQFELQGIRQIELDVFADPEGGLYANRPILAAIRQPTRAPWLDAPGMKVLHVQDVDFETTCPTLIECLETVKGWSDANPGHLPIMILVEAKDEEIPDPGIGFAIPVLFGVNEFHALDAEIRSVFPPEQLITPDDVRVPGRGLEASILSRGWPALAGARGRVLFALDNGGGYRLDYLNGDLDLTGRVLFTNGVPGAGDAAFVKRNDPIGSFEEIRELVRAGYLVRTRADADTVEARTGDTTQRDAALASGAQFVSTDYPEPNPAFGTGYFVEIPDGMPGRCNPITAPPGCREFALER